jgi:hypothetical protein
MMVGSVPPPADFLKRKKPSAKKDGETYVDHLETSIEEQNPTKFAYYSVQVLNSAGKSAGTSNQVKVPLIPTLPPFQGFAAKAEAAGVRISWECPHSVRPAGGIRYSFRIYRRLEAKPGEVVSGENKPGESKSSEIKIAEIPANDCAEAGINAEKSAVSSFLDQTFEWEQTYRYRGTVLSALETPGRSAAEIEGDDTPAAEIFAHDIFPPAAPAGLQAVFSGPGQAAFIDLIWTPVHDADLEGYDIYRHEVGAPPEKLNQDPVPVPAYRDAKIAPGKTYIYSVSAVDQRGNESARSNEASENVP